MNQRLFYRSKLVFDTIHFLIDVLRYIESMFKNIVHLPLQFVLKIMQLPSFLLDIVYLFPFTQLMWRKVLLSDSTWPLKHQKSFVEFDLKIV